MVSRKAEREGRVEMKLLVCGSAALERRFRPFFEAESPFAEGAEEREWALLLPLLLLAGGMGVFAVRRWLNTSELPDGLR